MMSLRKMMILIIAMLFMIMPSILMANSEKEMPNILVLNSSENHYSDIIKGIDDASDNRYQVDELIVGKSYTLEELDSAISKYDPEFLILIGNTSSMRYYHYQKKYEHKEMVPAVIVSFPFVNQLIDKMTNTLAIRYEVPIPIIASQMRYYSDKPIRNIGVVYRRWMRNYIDTSKEYAKLEEFNLKAYEIDNKPDLNSIKYHFRKMTNDNIDAIWILNDDYLINAKTIFTTIKPLLDKFNNPVLVNNDSLLQKQISIGTFSVVPDQYSMGVKSVNIIKDLIKKSSKENKSIDEILIEHNKILEPITTIETMNMDLNRKKGIYIKERKALEIEHIIE